MNFIQKFTKRDLGFSVLTGLITGALGWRIFDYLNITAPHFGKLVMVTCKYPSFAPCMDYQYSLPWVSLVLIVPIIWILGVMFGYFLGQWMDFFNQFGKFAAIGFTNFAVTAGVLNFFISITNYTSGVGYSLISGASFLVGVFSSYVWNKYWAFKSKKDQGGAGQFVKFFIVTIIAFGVNLLVSGFVVNYIHPLASMNAHAWANVGIIAGSAAGLIFSFVGFKLAVFK
ncbi:MAG: GtrA family protein [Candidatus Pacebacteria bacterium]|nr:GtrA family protein [Candidatus Paceibacterota bacterium]